MENLINNSVPLAFRLALKEKKIKREHLIEALKIQRSEGLRGTAKKLEDVLLAKSFISQKLRDELKKDVSTLDKQFYAKAVNDNLVEQEDIDYGKWLTANKKGGASHSVKDIIIDIGAITNEQCEEIATQQEQNILKTLDNASIQEDNVLPKKAALPVTKKKKVAIEDKGPVVEKEIKRDGKKDRAIAEQIMKRQNQDLSSDNLKIAFFENNLKAYIYVSKYLSTPLTANEVKTFAENHEVAYGIISDSKLKKILKSISKSIAEDNSEDSSEEEIKFVIASGKPPVPSKNAYVELCFDTDYLDAGIVDADGNIDFKSRGKLPFIDEGTLLAKIVPAVHGETGMDVYGNMIAVDEPLETIEIKAGMGVELSSDKSELYAAISGKPFVPLNGVISVLDEHIIDGDVDFKTGHIEFDGNVRVTGTIKDGFKVKGVNVAAEAVTGGEIIATGNVSVLTGIMESKISAMGDIEAGYIIKSEIDAFENLIVQKEVIESSVAISGFCSMLRGRIIGSDVSAACGIEVGQIGTDRSKPCTIQVGVDINLAAKLKVHNAAIGEKKAVLEDVQERLEEVEDDKINIQTQLEEKTKVQSEIQGKLKQLRRGAELTIEEPYKNRAIVNQIKIMEKKEAEVNEKISKFCDIENDLSASIASISEEVDVIMKSIEEITDKKNVLKESSDKKPRSAIVKQARLICAKTRVSGVHSFTTFKKNAMGVNIRETRNEDKKCGWEMRVS